jgi:hypothetical protein
MSRLRSYFVDTFFTFFFLFSLFHIHLYVRLHVCARAFITTATLRYTSLHLYSTKLRNFSNRYGKVTSSIVLGD